MTRRLSLPLERGRGLTLIPGTPRQDVVQRDDILKMIDEQVDKKLESFNQSFQTNIMPNLIKQFESSMRTLLEQTKPHVM
jgi:hypothetical protein